MRGGFAVIGLGDIQEARRRLRGVALRTPLLPCPRGQEEEEEEEEDRSLYFKPESLQPTGAFKLRGAYNKISSLSLEERRRGVVAHSSGNQRRLGASRKRPPARVQGRIVGLAAWLSHPAQHRAVALASRLRHIRLLRGAGLLEDHVLAGIIGQNVELVDDRCILGLFSQPRYVFSCLAHLGDAFGTSGP